MMPSQFPRTSRFFGASSSRRPARGVTLIEMMVAMVLGLALIAIMLSVYLGSRKTSVRLEQMSEIQQNVRSAFEYLSNDIRGVAYHGCAAGLAKVPALTGLSQTAFATRYGFDLEGYEYANTASAVTLSSDRPADTATVSNWSTNASGPSTIPISSIGGASGATPGSDVLVARGISGAPVRLTGVVANGSSTIGIENVPPSAACSGTASSVSGFCPSSHGLIASCVGSQYFVVSAVSATALTTANPVTGGYPATAEVFPVQTAAYYVRSGSRGQGPSLYRRVFNGQNGANGEEQELIEGVESMQIRYGMDTLPLGASAPYGNVLRYEVANNVDDWNHVLAVRVSLLMRAAAPVEAGLSLPASGLMNGVTITYPTGGARLDRRVFTTTVAIRNRVAY